MNPARLTNPRKEQNLSSFYIIIFKHTKGIKYWKYLQSEMRGAWEELHSARLPLPLDVFLACDLFLL